MCAVVRRSPSLQSVDRAVSVMEFLSRRGWSGVTEVSRELDIHKSTAYRLLTTLRDRGLVEQDAASEKYRLGFGLVLLAEGGEGRPRRPPLRQAGLRAFERAYEGDGHHSGPGGR